MSTERTPTPWHIERSIGRYEIWPKAKKEAHTYVGITQTKADAEFIVRACNAHDALVRALKDCNQILAAQVDGKYFTLEKLIESEQNSAAALALAAKGTT